MENQKNFSSEMLEKYISEEIKSIEALESDPKNWNENTQFKDQVTIRMEGE